MRRYLVVAHRTLGGAELMDELHRIRERDPYCRFHVIVPEFHPTDHMWTDYEVQHVAEQRLEEMLERMAQMAMGATGEVGDTNPVYAIDSAIRRAGAEPFHGIVLSTLPKGISRWWLFDVPRRVAHAHPELELIHVVSSDALVS